MSGSYSPSVSLWSSFWLVLFYSRQSEIISSGFVHLFLDKPCLFSISFIQIRNIFLNSYFFTPTKTFVLVLWATLEILSRKVIGFRRSVFISASLFNSIRSPGTCSCHQHRWAADCLAFTNLRKKNLISFTWTAGQRRIEDRFSTTSATRPDTAQNPAGHQISGPVDAAEGWPDVKR